jgi:hypothetical protein
MGIQDFVQSGVTEMHISRPTAAARLTYTHPTSTVPEHAQVTVADDEQAVFWRDGTVVGVLGPGRHTLAREAIPFVHQLAFAGGAELSCRIVFVCTAQRQLSIQSPLTPDAEPLRATATVRVDEPYRLVSSGLAPVGSDGDFEAGLCHMLTQGMGQVLTPLVQGQQLLLTQAGEVTRALTEAVGQGQISLAGYGVSVATLVMHGTSQPAPAPPAAPAMAPPVVPQAAAQAAATSELRWGGMVQFWDTLYEMPVRVNAFGVFESDRPIEGDGAEKVKALILETAGQAARSWTGTVMDLPAKQAAWAAYISQVVAPQVRHHLGVQGRVLVEAVNIASEDIAALQQAMGR